MTVRGVLFNNYCRDHLSPGDTEEDSTSQSQIIHSSQEKKGRRTQQVTVYKWCNSHGISYRISGHSCSCVVCLTPQTPNSEKKKCSTQVLCGGAASHNFYISSQHVSLSVCQCRTRLGRQEGHSLHKGGKNEDPELD